MGAGAGPTPRLVGSWALPSCCQIRGGALGQEDDSWAVPRSS